MPARRAAASPRGHPSMRVLEASTPYSSTPEARRAGFISGGRCGPYRGPAGTRSCRFVNLSFPIFIFSGILADTDEGTMRPGLRIFETGGKEKGNLGVVCRAIVVIALVEFILVLVVMHRGWP
jgi:hypothetical protein